eukprot:1160929-Pelagomonas_calceolata.AAC.6
MPPGCCCCCRLCSWACALQMQKGRGACSTHESIRAMRHRAASAPGSAHSRGREHLVNIQQRFGGGQAASGRRCFYRLCSRTCQRNHRRGGEQIQHIKALGGVHSAHDGARGGAANFAAYATDSQM